MQTGRPHLKHKYETIDVFNHFIPKEYIDALPKPITPSIAGQIKDRPAVTDIEYRLERIDEMGITRQLLSLGEQTVFDDLHFPVKILPDLAKAANDGFAKIIDKHPDRFSAIGTVSLYDVDSAIDELERCVKDLGFLGVQIVSNVGGKPLDLPEFDPFYDKLCRLNAGLWIHPTYLRYTYDWLKEYRMDNMVGWGMDESLAMLRIVRGGVFVRHPNLKVITHHMGVLIPFYADRIHRSIMRDGENGLPPKPFTKTPFEYLKMFYVDTAEGSWKPALVCSQLFFGPSRMLYATDYPFGANAPSDWPVQVINTINELDITEEEKEMIFSGNAKKLFGL